MRKQRKKRNERAQEPTFALDCYLATQESLRLVSRPAASYQSGRPVMERNTAAKGGWSSPVWRGAIHANLEGSIRRDGMY